MGCPSEVSIGADLVFSITTHDPDTGVVTDADSLPTYRIYEDETATAILTGSMAKLDDANTTGFYSKLIECTTDNGFGLNHNYTIYIEATVDGEKDGITYGFMVPSTITVGGAATVVPATAQTIYERDILTAALNEINVEDPEQAPSYKNLMQALYYANMLLDTWITRGLMAYYLEINSFAFATSKQTYTIGAAGADFALDRPVKVDRANLIRVGVTPNERVKLDVIEIETYADIRYPADSAEEPTHLYYQPAYPLGVLYPYPYPTNVTNKLELFTQHQLTKFSEDDLSNVLLLPPGYQAALQHSLAEMLCIPFGKTISPELERMARRARAAVQGLNQKPIHIKTIDSGMPQSAEWC